MPAKISEEVEAKIHELHDKGFSICEISRITGCATRTVSAKLGGITRMGQLKQEFLKPINVNIDLETEAQLKKLAEMWGESRSSVTRTMIEWGMESLSDAEKTVLNKVAADFTDG